MSTFAAHTEPKTVPDSAHERERKRAPSSQMGSEKKKPGPIITHPVTGERGFYMSTGRWWALVSAPKLGPSTTQNEMQGVA